MSCNVAAAHLSNIYGLVTSFVDFFPRDVGEFSTVSWLCFASDFPDGMAVEFLAVRAVAFRKRFSVGMIGENLNTIFRFHAFTKNGL